MRGEVYRRRRAEQAFRPSPNSLPVPEYGHASTPGKRATHGTNRLGRAGGLRQRLHGGAGPQLLQVAGDHLIAVLQALVDHDAIADHGAGLDEALLGRALLADHIDELAELAG